MDSNTERISKPPNKGVQAVSKRQTVHNSKELIRLPILRSPCTTASSTHGTATTSTHVSERDNATTISEYNLRGNTHKRVCHVIGCEKAAFGDMDRYPTVPLCEAHLKDNERRVRSNVEQTGKRGKAIFTNNVCEYPDCATKPKYGLIKGGPARACKHHKKAGMFSSRNGQILYAIHDGDALGSSLPSSKNSAPPAIKTALGTSSDNAKSSHNGNLPQALRVKPKTPKTLEPSTSSKGTAPSVEMKVLQTEREKVVAEARATGKRPRFPSRKVLEASGKLDKVGVQWMTKDMFQADVQLRKDLRDRQKEDAAAERKENTARVKRSHSNVSLGQPGKKISKRNLSNTTARKGKQDGIDMRDYSKGTDVPIGFFNKNENTNGVQLEGISAHNMECEPAGRS